MITKLLTPGEVANIFGVKVKTIYQKVYRNQLPYVKIGSSLRFREADIDELITCCSHKQEKTCLPH